MLPSQPSGEPQPEPAPRYRLKLESRHDYSLMIDGDSRSWVITGLSGNGKPRRWFAYRPVPRPGLERPLGPYESRDAALEAALEDQQDDPLTN